MSCKASLETLSDGICSEVVAMFLRCGSRVCVSTFAKKQSASFANGHGVFSPKITYHRVYSLAHTKKCGGRRKVIACDVPISKEEMKMLYLGFC